MPFCKYCGATHDADAVFCTECGKPISKKIVPPAKSIVEPPQATASEEVIRVEDGKRPYLPGDPITPEMEERINAHREKVAQYTLSLAIYKQLWRDRPDLFGEDEWKKVEPVLAEKYGLPDNSIFRQKELPDFEAERNSKATPRRRNSSYTKRDTEYWSRFDKTEY